VGQRGEGLKVGAAGAGVFESLLNDFDVV
jgi:hypothetical protein